MKTKDNVQSEKDKILKKALPVLEREGFTSQAYQEILEKSKTPKALAAQYFPARIKDLSKHFMDWVNRDMMARLEKLDPESMRIRDRIKTAILIRYEILEPHKNVMRANVKFWGLPHRHLEAPKLVWNTADLMWNWAGDTSADYNFYTKRGLLSKILVATTLYWLSGDDKDLEPFVERRIDNVMQFGKIIAQVKSFIPGRKASAV